ncbi:ankyrin repeat domain-containing protein [Desulfosarcina sp. OttesenSCG-928-B08]|nr:ankyrin repeat domain-containing protein [Desulfosarcina sp. OttesenSCG-928-B08]
MKSTCWFHVPILFFILLAISQMGQTAWAKEALLPERVRILAGLGGYYEAATPAQVREMISGHSLAGVLAKFSNESAPRTPLMRAARETPHGEVIDLLVKAGCDPQATSDMTELVWTETGSWWWTTESVRTALHLAVYNPDPAAIRALLRYKPDLNALTKGTSGYTALSLAAKIPDRIPHLRALLAAGARPQPTEKHSIWRLFLGWNMDPDKDQFRELPDATPHHLTVSPEEAAIKVAALLDAGVKPTTEALRLALLGGQHKAAKLLLDAGVNPAWQDKYGCNMLHAALIRPKSSLEYRRKYPDVAPADPAILARLLPYNDVNGGAYGTPLEQACKSGMGADVARFLVRSGATWRTENNSLLFMALGSPHDCADLVQYLLELGFSPLDKGKERAFPLRVSTRFPQKPGCALALVQAGADIQPVMDEMDRDFAIEAGIIDKAGNLRVRPSGLAEAERRRLHAERERIMAAARQNPNDALFNPLVYLVATPDEIKSLIGKRSLSGIRVEKEEISMMQGRTNPVGFVIALPVLIFQKEFWTGKRTVKHHYTALSQAAGTTPHPEVIHLLAKAGCKVRDLDSEAMFKALYNPNPDVLEAVLSYKPELRMATFYLGTPLHILAGTAPWQFKKEHFRLLLAAGAHPNITFGQDNETPLMKAAHAGNTEAGRMLLKAGADVRPISRIGKRALDMAIESEAWELAGDLLKAGSPVRGSGKRSTSALERLAEAEDADPVFARALIATTGPKSEETEKAILLAARSGNLTLLRELVSCGKPPAQPEVLSEALIIAAALGEKNSVAVAKFLISCGADVNAIDEKQGSALHYAAVRATTPDLADVLLKAGARVNATERQGFTPLLSLACCDVRDEDRKPVPTADLLLRAGANPNPTTGNGWLPLACSLKQPELTTRYLKAGANANARARGGWTMLTLAASDRKFSDSIPPLLAAGADPAQRDENGRLPLEVALEKENGRAVAYLQAALMKRGKG